MSDFPFEGIGGPSAGRAYGPGKMPVRGNFFMNRVGSATAVGDVLQADVQNTDTSATTYGGTNTSILAQCIAPRAGFITGEEAGFIVVAQTIAADNAEFFGVWHGQTDAFVIAASGSVALGSQLVATVQKNFDLVKATNEVRWAMGLEAVATPTTRTLGSVLVEYNGMMAKRDTV